MNTSMLNRPYFQLNLRWLLWLIIIFLLFSWTSGNLLANDASGCPLTSVNGVANNCYTATPPIGSATIDGVLTGAEWTGLPSKDLTGAFPAKVRFKRSGNNLHFLVSVNDALFHEADQIRLHFDPLHNHATTADDIEFHIKRGNVDHRKISNDGATNVAWVPAANLAINDNTPSTPDFPTTGWAAEFTITATDLGKADLPEIVGFAVLVADQNNETSWPSPFPASAATWANLKTRYPIEYMIVLDQSGSMLSQNKWTDAKNAANFLANTMAILREATYFEDKLGLVTFSWNVGTETDQTDTPKSLAAISAFPLGNYTDAAPPAVSPQSNYWTPIGKGLDAAFNALGIGVEETQRVMLFLSDGLHNRPTTYVPLLPSHLNYDPCPGVADWGICPIETDIRVQVNTAALGQDSGVDTALLTNIKNRFAGKFGSTYNISTNVEDLKETFISSLDDLYQMNLASSSPAGTEFTVNAAERKLVVIQSWTNVLNATTISLQRKATVGDTFSNVACSSPSASDTSVGFGICIVNDPQPGIWRALDGAANPLTADRQFILVDLNLRARFSIDQKVHGTGQDIVLTADLNEAGLPVTNDPTNHPAKVTVSIKRPGEGFGTYVSLHTPDSCEPQPPELPPILREFGLARGNASPVAFTATVPQPSNADVKPARFAKIETLLKQCKKDDLIFIEDPGIDLYDDGTHGDLTPNDGIYTLRFLNTQYEGSYVFRFKATGTSPSGSAFNRVKTMAEYVRVEVDSSRTDFDSRNYQQSGNIVIKEFFVTPRDRLGGYLGPGYPDQIQFYTTGGQWISAVNDYNNGIYSRFLRYDPTQVQPDVIPVVQGKPIVSKPWWYKLHRCLEKWIFHLKKV